MRRTGPTRPDRTPRHATGEAIRATLAALVLLGVVLAVAARPLATLAVLAGVPFIRAAVRRRARPTRPGSPAAGIPVDAAAEPR